MRLVVVSYQAFATVVTVEMGETDDAGITVMERKRRSGTRTSTQDAEETALGQGAVKREKPSSSAVIQYHDVTAAAFRIRKGVKETPLKVSVNKAKSTTQLSHFFKEIGTSI